MKLIYLRNIPNVITVRISADKIIAYFKCGLNKTQVDLVNGMSMKFRTPVEDIDKQFDSSPPDWLENPTSNISIVQ